MPCRARHLAWAAIRSATGASYREIADVWGCNDTTVWRGVCGKTGPAPHEVTRVLEGGA
jgi:hypothetical protein